MSAALSAEDLEAGTGSATALLRTVVGSVLRPIGGWLSTAGAVELMGALGVPPATARSSLARLVARGVLRRDPREGLAGYALEPAAVPMLERGDARIFGARAASGTWCLVSFSFPEHQRSLRNRLRRRLSAIGCGAVADGLWIGPSSLEQEIAGVVAEFEAGEGDRTPAVLFAHAEARGDVTAGLARWYDLAFIRETHDAFVARFSAADAEPPASDREAFALWIRALDEWRVIPYRDPGLPPEALPPDWPGDASASLFASLRSALEGRAIAYAAAVAAERTR